MKEEILGTIAVICGILSIIFSVILLAIGVAFYLDYQKASMYSKQNNSEYICNFPAGCLVKTKQGWIGVDSAINNFQRIDATINK